MEQGKVTKISFNERAFIIISIIVYSGAVYRSFSLGPAGVDQADPTEGGGTYALLVYAMFGSIYLITAYKLYYSRDLLRYMPNRLFYLMLLYAFASIAWSDYPLVTFKKEILTIGTTLFGVYLASKFRFVDVLVMTETAFFIMAGLSIAFVIFLPQYGIMSHRSDELNGTWEGVFIHKNILARAMVLEVIIASYLYYSLRIKKYIFRIFLALVLIVFSKSGTGILAVFFIGFLFVPIKILKLKLNHLIVLTISVIIIGVFTMSYLLNSYGEILGLMGKDETLTGRTQLWGMLFLFILKKPFFGYGLSTFWLGNTGPSAIIESFITWEPQYAHNGFIDLTLDFGFVGLTLYLVMFFRYFLIYMKKHFGEGKIEYLWGLLFFAFLFCYNFSESQVLKENNIFWVLFVFTILIYTRKNVVRKTKRGYMSPSIKTTF